MVDTWSLDILPCDVLLTIFDYCNEYDLLRLSEVCKRFYDIVRTDVVWAKKSKRFLVTNQTSERFRERCNIILPSYTTWRISYNWHHGIYQKNMIFTHKSKVMPWLKMTNELLWWCGGNELHGFDRKKERKTIKRSKGNSYYAQNCIGGDISKFVLWKNYVVCGYTTGSIIYFSKNIKNVKGKCYAVKIFRNIHPISAIDATSENIVTASESGTVKIQRHPDMDSPDINIYDNEMTCIKLMDKVRSISIDPTGVKCAIGSSGTTNIPPLHVIDMEHYSIDAMRHAWKHGAGILDMVWEDPNTLLTCGYDTYIRKWDLRIGRCVCSWADPTDATLYCISSDHQYTMITGTQYNCLAVLWDQRQSDFVQLYYVNSQASSERSPIYSIQFDSTYMYCATDKHVIQLNFSTHSYQRFDYKSLYPVS